MLRDIQYAFRVLRQNPGFTLTAVVSIALAVGANSAIFSYADGLLLRPLPVANPSEVVSLRSVSPSLSSLPMRGTGGMSYPDFDDFRKSNRSFEGLVAYDVIAAGLARNRDDQPQLKLGYQVTGDFFRVLGIEPQLGRGFRPDEDEVPGRDAVVVLTHDLWKNEFASDPAIAGRSVRLNDVEFTIAGVAPESFTGMDQFVRPAFFVPVMIGPRLFPAEDFLHNRSQREFLVKGRLKPGVSFRAAAQEASAFATALEQSYPETNHGFGATVSSEIEMRLLNYPLLGILVSSLFTISVVILLIACANIANLMLSRGRGRAREIAVRLAIGASRPRLVRLLLVESLLIALAGGALALLVADMAAGVFSTMEIPADVPVQPSFQFDPRVVWFTVVLSVASAMLFGLVPALQSTRLNLVSAIKAGESTHARKRFFGRYALVVVQIAGSMILMVFETQGRRTFDNALAGDTGFRRDHRLTMRFDPSAAGYTPEQTQQFYETLVERSLLVTGIKSAALTSAPPMTFDFGGARLVPEGYDFPPGRESVELFFSYTVDHRYFATFGVPILAGRGFRATDRADSPRVAVVNEAFAREYLGEHPIGKRLRIGDGNGPVVEVVGVSVTGKTMFLIEPPVQVVYFPLSQNPMTRMTLIAETNGDPAAAAGPLQEMVRSIDANMPVFRIRTMESLFEGSTVKTLRMVGTIYKSASLLGLALALVGLYAVVSYQVAQRTREIGIRIALGAERRQVIEMFVKRAATLSLTGISAGLALSVAANVVDNSGIATPYDRTLLVLVSLGMLLTTLLAAAIPARRASRIDPQKALRQE